LQGHESSVIGQKEESAGAYAEGPWATPAIPLAPQLLQDPAPGVAYACDFDFYLI